MWRLVKTRTVVERMEEWSPYATVYDPIKVGSIDGTDTQPHDKGIVRALHAEYQPNRHVKGRPECTIFVSRLPPKVTKESLKNSFMKFGKIRRFRLVKDIVTGMPKGYAFVEYEHEHYAEEAFRKANKMSLDGHSITVDFECERLLKGWKPRRLGGGFGGQKESGQLRFGGRNRPFKKPIINSGEIQKDRERRVVERESRSTSDERDTRKDSHRAQYRNDSSKKHRSSNNH